MLQSGEGQGIGGSEITASISNERVIRQGGSSLTAHPILRGNTSNDMINLSQSDVGRADHATSTVLSCEEEEAGGTEGESVISLSQGLSSGVKEDSVHVDNCESDIEGTSIRTEIHDELYHRKI
jgi:hypothetical protein